MNTTYFRLFRVNLEGECPFWKEKKTPELCTAATFLPEPACSLNTNPSPFPFESRSSEVDHTITKQETEALAATNLDCEDESHPSFWLDICSNIPTGKGDFVNLQLNPERWTGFNGSHVWQAIYNENCFKENSQDQMCYEERVLWRLLSGMHASINTHINLNYFPPKNGTGPWKMNPARFMEQYGSTPHLKNLHFAFVVLLRALRKAAPVLYTHQFDASDGTLDHTNRLVQRLLDSHILHSCSRVFDAFDENLLFQPSSGPSTANTLKRQFKDVFRNISSVLNCVSCQKCKLHGKLQLLGLGTALKVLLTPVHLLPTSLNRDELVALFNTIAKFSKAIVASQYLAQVYFEEFNRERVAAPLPVVSPRVESPPPPPPAARVKGTLHDPGLVDVTLSLLAALSQEAQLTEAQEDHLVDLAVTEDPTLLLLAKNYRNAPASFRRHALRTSQTGLGLTSASGPPVVVVGAGLAGLVCALTLLDRGASVVLLDKENFIGGNSAKASSGLNAVEPDNSFGDTVDIYRADTKLGGNQQVQQNPLLERLVVDSYPAFKWLRDRAGLKLDQVGQLGGHSKPRTHRPDQGMAGSELVFGLNRIVKEFIGHGLTMKFNSKLTSLVKDPSGRVTGVVFEQEGKRTELAASNVVIATGGFSAGPEVLRKYRPDLAEVPTSNGRWATGDGHVLVEAAGGHVVDMDDIQVHPTGFVDPANPHSPQKFLCAEILRGVGAILLNSKGRRFCNELGTRDYVVARMKEQPSNESLLVLSEHMASFAPAHVPFYTSKGLLRKVNLAGLSRELGVSEEEARAALKAYNSAASEQKDEFGKKYFNNAPMDVEGNFYVGTVVPVVHYCIGGVQVDTDGRVLHAEREPIPGLWAAGEVVGGIHGTNRLGGNALTECVVFGRAVGNAIPVNEHNQAPANQQSQQSKPTTQAAATITQAELEKHNHAGSIWVSIQDKVYDLTAFAPTHPGGFQSIVDVAGKNATDIFLAVHSTVMLDDFTPLGNHVNSNNNQQTKTIITRAELARHNNKQSAWINVFDQVYDFTAFAAEHPGGEEALLGYAGTNATKVFLAIHSVKMLDDFTPIGVMAAE